jgi:hypothetical protein
MSFRVRVITAGVAAGAIASGAFAFHALLMQYTGSGTDHLESIAFGDVNGDERSDIVVGADVGGYVSVYDGANLSQTLHEFVGAVAGDGFGTALAVADLNADGSGDIVVGAPSWDGPAGNNVGYVRAFDGVTGAQLFELQGQKGTDASDPRWRWAT